MHLNGTLIPSHQTFLNEARLSAIALSLYFAGLLVTVPPAPPGAVEYPRLLVLDDVLIGLDMANRLPVLEILRSHFKDWQVLLFTHDRMWADIVQLQTQEEGTWCYHELYVRKAEGGLEIPIQRPRGEGPDYYLARAKAHLDVNDERAAVVYTRAAFESKIKSYCEKKKVPVAYNRDERRISGAEFWDAATQHAKEKAATNPTLLETLKLKFGKIEAFRKVVLNPLSHSGATTIVGGRNRRGHRCRIETDIQLISFAATGFRLI